MKEKLAESQQQLTHELETLLKPTTPVGALKRYVDRVIIPKMNIAWGRTEPMSGSEIVSKLFSIDPHKPGEMVEYMNTLYQKKAGFTRDPVEIALEIADIIYYTRQFQVPTFIQKANTFIESQGVTYGDALAFCCLKYSIRLKKTDHEEIKQEEYAAMKSFLEQRGPRSFFDYHLFGRITFVNTQ